MAQVLGSGTLPVTNVLSVTGSSSENSVKQGAVVQTPSLLVEFRPTPKLTVPDS